MMIYLNWVDRQCSTVNAIRDAHARLKELLFGRNCSVPSPRAAEPVLVIWFRPLQWNVIKQGHHSHFPLIFSWPNVPGMELHVTPNIWKQGYYIYSLTADGKAWPPLLHCFIDPLRSVVSAHHHGTRNFSLHILFPSLALVQMSLVNKTWEFMLTPVS